MIETDTDTDSGRPASRLSPFRAAPLPAPPCAPRSWPDRSELLRAQAQTLNTLVREDLSRARAAVYLLCALALSLAVTLAPAAMADTLTSDTSDSGDVAVSAVAVIILLSVFAVPSLLVLRALSDRAAQRWRLLRAWAAVDRGHDAPFPAGYGIQTPHARFINALLALLLVIALAGALVASWTDPQAAAALPGVVIAGLFAWAPIKKYAVRYSWAGREQAVRGRARMRRMRRDQLAEAAPVQRSAVHPALLCIAWLSPPVIIGIVLLVARPKSAVALAVFGLLALACLAMGAPLVLLKRRRERAVLTGAADALRPSFAAGTVVHPVRYGLNELPDQSDASSSHAWDDGPPRTGALTIRSETLYLRGTDGGALEIPLAALTGVAYLPPTVAWTHPSVDLLLQSGAAIELRSPQAKDIAVELAGSGVSTTPM